MRGGDREESADEKDLEFFYKKGKYLNVFKIGNTLIDGNREQCE